MEPTPSTTPAPTPAPVAPTTDPQPPAVDPKSADAPPAPEEGKGGKDAVLADLAKERDKRQALEQKLADSQATQQAQLDAIAKALGLKSDAPDPAQIAQELGEAQRTAAENAAALTRYRGAVEKAVPAHLVEFITGSTQEEVDASIEKVLAAFSSSPQTPTGPKPDPSQGPQGAPTSLDALIAAAEASGDTREVIRLKSRKGIASN